ncbi:MAG: SDR family oxidoreductase [Ilumatobacteraceae bacterium]
MELGLDGARALVLGSSSGLGRAIASSLVAEGADVAVTSRDRDRADGAASATGSQAALVGDLSEPGVGARLVTEAVDALGGLDICVVNTGAWHARRHHRHRWRRRCRLPLDAAPGARGRRAAAAHLAVRGRGRLLFLTARSVVETTPDLALSSVMRSGVTAAARSLAVELAPDVLVNVIVTGQFDTPALDRFEAAKARSTTADPDDGACRAPCRDPLGRLGRAEELAAVVTFLCSTRASFVTGTLVRVDGGAVRGF